MEKSIIIEFYQYTKKYNNKVVLDDINLKINSGSIYGFIGRNGSGKSMLFKAIVGLINSTSGYVTVDNKIIGKDIDFPSNVGALIESPGFLPNLSGYDNLKILADINKIIKDEDIKSAISFVGLDPEDKRSVKKYSMGMKQRLGIAQAIMEKPNILVLDEPMNALDNNGVNDIRNYLLDLNKKGVTILISSHNKEDIELLCNNVYEMDNGKITKHFNNKEEKI